MDTPIMLIIAVVVIAIAFIIQYQIVKAAVSSANREIIEQLRGITGLKVLELKKGGHDIEELRSVGGYYTQINRLAIRKQHLTPEEYANELKKLHELFE